MGWHMHRSGYIPIDRDNPRDMAKSIQEAARAINNGTNAIAFPEGGRSRDGVLGKFYGGVFTLALRTNVPVVPVSLEGSYRVIVPQTMRVNPGVILRIKIDRPIDLATYSKAEKNRLMDDVFRIMYRNLEDLRARRQPGEERRDAVYRWIHPISDKPSN
jgi:1-acyl-sn-glycerol-3-phosphate acyltransferase